MIIIVLKNIFKWLTKTNDDETCAEQSEFEKCTKEFRGSPKKTKNIFFAKFVQYKHSFSFIIITNQIKYFNWRCFHKIFFH